MNYRRIKEFLYSLYAIPYKIAMRINCNQVYAKRVRMNKLDVNTSLKNEKEYLAKWKRLDKSITPFYYRFFSHYIKSDTNIVSEYVSHIYIEPILNPFQYRDYYEDKNVYNRIFPSEYMPKTIIRSIQGMFFDENYESFNITDSVLFDFCCKYEKIILKPTVDTSSGNGVMLFVRSNDNFIFIDDENILLSVAFLKKKYKGDFIIQECLKQSCFLAQFNSSSVNTIRIHTYRSVKTNEVHITGAVLRIGAIGSFCDNAHAGGLFVGINSGKLSNKLYNQWGNSFDCFNGLEFSKNTYIIPNYNRIEEFAKQIASKILHHRSIALDITLDENDIPRLIEFNLSAFGSWVFQFSVGAAYGECTDEIIEYCSGYLRHNNKILGNFKTKY